MNYVVLREPFLQKIGCLHQVTWKISVTMNEILDIRASLENQKSIVS